MDKVYLVTHSDHDEYSIHGVFADRAMAMKHRDLLAKIGRYYSGDLKVEEHPVVTEQPQRIYAYYARIKDGSIAQILDCYSTICGYDMDGDTVSNGKDESIIGVGFSIDEAKEKAMAHRARILAERGVTA